MVHHVCEKTATPYHLPGSTAFNASGRKPSDAASEFSLRPIEISIRSLQTNLNFLNIPGGAVRPRPLSALKTPVA